MPLPWRLRPHPKSRRTRGVAIRLSPPNKSATSIATRAVLVCVRRSTPVDSEVMPKVETMTPHPKSPYALQKLVGEYYAAVFSSVYGLETVTLRYFNVYGPRQDPSSPYSGVLSLFMKSILKRCPPTIFGDGEQSRDFTYVDDVAALNLRAARARNVSGRGNTGSGCPIRRTERSCEVRLLSSISRQTLASRKPEDHGPAIRNAPDAVRLPAANDGIQNPWHISSELLAFPQSAIRRYSSVAEPKVYRRWKGRVPSAGCWDPPNASSLPARSHFRW